VCVSWASEMKQATIIHREFELGLDTRAPALYRGGLSLNLPTHIHRELVAYTHP